MVRTMAGDERKMYASFLSKYLSFCFYSLFLFDLYEFILFILWSVEESSIVLVGMKSN